VVHANIPSLLPLLTLAYETTGSLRCTRHLTP
jgi:hypothetical protein